MYWKKKRTHTFWLNIPKFPYEKEIQTEVCGRTNSQMVGGKRLIVRNTCALILTSNNQRTYGIDYSPSNTAIETGTIETEQRKPPKLAENTAIKYWILPEFYDLNFNSLFCCHFVVCLLFLIAASTWLYLFRICLKYIYAFWMSKTCMLLWSKEQDYQNVNNPSKCMHLKFFENTQNKEPDNKQRVFKNETVRRWTDTERMNDKIINMTEMRLMRTLIRSGYGSVSVTETSVWYFNLLFASMCKCVVTLSVGSWVSQ